MATQGGPVEGIYLDAAATTPVAAAVLETMLAVQQHGWANPSSLHGFGLAAAEALERARWQCAALLGCSPDELVFTSGGTESIHLALLGVAARLQPGRLLISSVEHPATEAAAQRLLAQGWQVQRLPVNRIGLVDQASLEEALGPPTRLVSLIWGQSEVGTLQDVQLLGRSCRLAGVPLHLDAVQVIGHQPIDLAALPVDLLSIAAHKFQGPRGIGALVVRRGLELQASLGGGAQESRRRAGTEPVVLASGMARALQLAQERLTAAEGRDPLLEQRDRLLVELLDLSGLRLSGPDPRLEPLRRLPHHISVLVSGSDGRPLSGRALVREMWQEGFAISSGSACSSSGSAASPVLQALGCTREEAGSGLRISLGPWLGPEDLNGVASALDRARQRLEASP
jgi:cysteine desulfurase